jgi:hypothetical protein
MYTDLAASRSLPLADINPNGGSRIRRQLNCAEPMKSRSIKELTKAYTGIYARGNAMFETYAPVVQWTTIRLMFILEIPLGLKSKHGDVICGFRNGKLEPDENVYVKMPLGFSQYAKDRTKKVLKLNKTLYSSTMQLREHGIDLEQEDDAAGFLGVMLERNPETKSA